MVVGTASKACVSEEVCFIINPAQVFILAEFLREITGLVREILARLESLGVPILGVPGLSLGLS